MTKKETIQSIMKFLELALSENALMFFYDIKKSFSEDEDLFYDFLYHYLTIQKDGIAPIEGRLYADFCTYFSHMLEIQSEEKVLEQVARYAKYYLILRLEYIEDRDLARSISVINAYEAWDAYPFLLELMDDYENNRIDLTGLLNMLHMVEDLAFKRLQTGEENCLSGLGLEINKMLYNVNESRHAG